ncbi:MAG: DUF2063 domain-containing protein [Methylophilaceae bacterium]
MSQLAQLQAGFQAYLMDDTRKKSFKAIVDDKKVGATKRLKIYHDAYRFRIVDALATAYPKLLAYLGDDLFVTMARSYLTKTPSVYPNLRWYGADMHEYLATVMPNHPIAAELAQFEWVLSLAFDAEDLPQLSIQDLAAIPPENWGELCFKFQPALHLLPFNWNTVAVWKALDIEDTPPKAAKVVLTYWLIWRQDLTSKFRSLENTELLALKLSLEGASFGALCESLYEEMGENASNQAAQYLAGWLEAGLICALKN